MSLMYLPLKIYQLAITYSVVNYATSNSCCFNLVGYLFPLLCLLLIEYAVRNKYYRVFKYGYLIFYYLLLFLFRSHCRNDILLIYDFISWSFLLSIDVWHFYIVNKITNWELQSCFILAIILVVHCINLQ